MLEVSCFSVKQIVRKIQWEKSARNFECLKRRENEFSLKLFFHITDRSGRINRITSASLYTS